MYEILIIVTSSFLMGYVSAVSAWVDGHAYDEKLGTTRYHRGEPWDEWHIWRRVERYGSPLVALVSGAALYDAWPILIPCWLLAGLIGWRWASKWKSSIW